MLISFWSLKGGSGCSVTAALTALHRSADDPNGVLLVDLCGDLPLILGCDVSLAPGVTDWLSTESPAPGGIGRLVSEVSPGLGLIVRGQGAWPDTSDEGALVAQLATHPSTVIVDAGCLVGRGPRAQAAALFAAQATRSILVTRACYLALRRVPQMPVTPSGVVLLREQHRALTAVEVEDAVGAPVLAQVEVDPVVARAVDAGVLVSRRPRGLDSSLRGVV